VVSRSIGAGYLVVGGLFPDIRVWPALLHAAALAPTDDRGKDSPLIKRERASFWGRRALRYGIGAAFLGNSRHAQPSSFRRGSSGRGAAADNPRLTIVEAEVLTPAGRRWVERTQGPLDLLAVIFLIDVILLWSFPDGPAFLRVLNVTAWIVWACLAVDYVARFRLSIGKARFVRTHKLDLLMVLLRLLRIFLLLRRSLASVSTEKIAGSIVSLVVAAVFVSAFFMWRVEYNAPGATITTFRYALWWAIVTTTTVGYGDYTPVTLAGRVIATAVMIVGVGLIGRSAPP
jgi:voltage-gated potassium channel